ncbi:MAG: hypothetical protein V4812_03920 [Pseudomonadota bacterium]
MDSLESFFYRNDIPVQPARQLYPARRTLVRSGVFGTRQLIALLLSCIVCHSAYPCYVPTGALENDPAELIANTPEIRLALAIAEQKLPEQNSATAGSPGRYSFRVIETLKGSAASEIALTGDLDKAGLWDTSFNDHQDTEFWISRSGRLGNTGDCRTTPAPEFVLGQQYLLFIGGPDDSKKFERIDNSQDQWLKFVAAHLLYEFRGDQSGSTRE